MEIAGYNKLLSPAARDDRLVEFYRRDIEVRVAGPLASLRYDHELHAKLLETVRPETSELWLWGGASVGEVIGDEDIAIAEASILARWFRFIPEKYVEWVKGEVWKRTIADGQRWRAIIELGTRLEDVSTMPGEEASDILVALGLTPFAGDEGPS